MYSLTFRVRVTTPTEYGRNGTVHAAGSSMLSPVRGVFAGMRCVRVRHACGVRWAWRITAGFCISIVLPTCHSNATRAPIANPPNSAQLGDIPYHASKLHPVPGPCNSVGMRPRTDTQTDRHTHRHTDTRDHNTFLVVYDSREMQWVTMWLHGVECSQYSIRLEALGYVCDCLSERGQI